MVEHNLILTDLMKTGNHIALENFWRHNNLPNQQFDYISDYYTISGINTENYKRKFAIIDHRMDNHGLWKSKTYWEDLKNRINELKKKADQIKKKSIESYGKQEDTK